MSTLQNKRKWKIADIVFCEKTTLDSNELAKNFGVSPSSMRMFLSKNKISLRKKKI